MKKADVMKKAGDGSVDDKKRWKAWVEEIACEASAHLQENTRTALDTGAYTDS